MKISWPATIWVDSATTLARFIANNDPEQADIAESLMHTHTVFLSRTVLLETEWVLRSRYRVERDPLVGFLQGGQTDGRGPGGEDSEMTW